MKSETLLFLALAGLVLIVATRPGIAEAMTSHPRHDEARRLLAERRRNYRAGRGAWTDSELTAYAGSGFGARHH